MQPIDTDTPSMKKEAGGVSSGGRRFPTSLLVPVLALAGCWALWAILPFVIQSIANRSAQPTWVGNPPELDAWLIHRGLVAAPRFVDTLRWWTGSWVMQLPFYRPLSSYVFWLEWKAFGDQEGLYNVPAAAAHVVAAVLFTAWVYRLAERERVTWPALAALVGTAGFIGVLEPYRQDVVLRILMWKNQPDSLAAACCFAALLCYQRAQDGRRGALAAAGAWYLAGCAFKEIAVPLPLVLLALEAPLLRGKQRRPVWERLAVMGALGALFMAVRWAAISGVGFTYGSNTAWRARTLVNLLGPFAPLAASREWTGNLAGIWTYLVGLGLLWVGGERTERQVLWLCLGEFLLLGLGWSLIGWSASLALQGAAWRMPVTPADYLTGVFVCMQPVALAIALGTVAFLVALTAAGRWCRPALGVGLVWTVAFLAPLTLSPGPSHRYYIPQVGYLLIYACAAGVGVPLLMRMLWPSLMPTLAAFRR